MEAPIPFSAAHRAKFAVLHVEDDPFWAAYIGKLIHNWPEFQMIGVETTGAAGIARYTKTRPDVLLLDLRLPDMGGFSVLDTLAVQGERPCVLLLTGKRDDVTLFQARSPLVLGMVSKSTEIESALRAALAAVAAGRRYYSPDVASAIRRSTSSPEAFHKILSEREQEVVRFVAEGHSDHEIAANFGISSATVHRHRQNVMNKLGLHTTPKLMAWAMEKGFSGR